MTQLTTWNVRKGQDFRIRAQHPWVFSNELVKSPKGISPGQLIELQTEHGEFLAVGYGNPNSLIAFRVLSFKNENLSQEWLINKVCKSWEKRFSLGLKQSQRICYSENDLLSGLIIDHYMVEQNGKRGQVFAVQISTYGMEKLMGDVLEFFKKFHTESKDFHNIPWSHTAVVLRNDMNQRKLEGLEVKPPEILKPIEFMNLDDIQILIENFRGETLKLSTNLHTGQKTGFFLDQKQNIELVLTQLEKKWKHQRPTQFKMLDICSYVGHWSTQVAALAKRMEIPIEVVTADISEKALQFSEKNVQQYTQQVTSLPADVLVDLEKLTESEFDLVICDPPAFIKNKKDLHKGRHAYMKLNSQALRLTKPGGLVVSCSCSGIFLKEYLQETLVKASKRSNREIQILLDGGHGPDHPHLPSFPEGFYLKMFLCAVY